MSEKQWVQHISGQGEKWEVTKEEPLIYRSYDRGIPLSLPKSEYRNCEPPERWVDVTAECSTSQNSRVIYHNMLVVEENNGYRLRKVKCCDAGGLDCSCPKPGQWAFIVERKEQP